MTLRSSGKIDGAAVLECKSLQEFPLVPKDTTHAKSTREAAAGLTASGTSCSASGTLAGHDDGTLTTLASLAVKDRVILPSDDCLKFPTVVIAHVSG